MQLLLRRQDPVPSAFQLLRTSSAESRMVCGDVVAVWEVALSDGVYRIEFAHGTTTGKRVVYVNGTEVLRKDWMFKLVGKETFTLGTADTKATINIEAISGFTYEYSLNVDGKSLQKFIDNRAKTTKTWVVQVDGEDYRVVLEKDTMDVWCNGQKMDTTVRITTPEPEAPPGVWVWFGPELTDEVRITQSNSFQTLIGRSRQTYHFNSRRVY
ncbi:hypothetical protein XENORESO_002560 [Xenotaenia resolanae]|uniref:Fas apoptotic inhibitory molecule 1 n=1 Tax=Xenotaenia resolanae TaxID=208358 RepID=A0ABV0VQZ5_9TELE